MVPVLRGALHQPPGMSLSSDLRPAQTLSVHVGGVLNHLADSAPRLSPQQMEVTYFRMLFMHAAFKQSTYFDYVF